MRFRTYFNIWIPLAILIALFALDPDSGLGIKLLSPTTTVLVLKYLSGLLLISGAFWTVKVLFPYPEADTRDLFFHAGRGPTGAGLALVARMIMFAVVVYAFASSAHATDGFGQLTRAYRADGSERFDALAEMRTIHPELYELTWQNIYQSPGLQLRAMVLKVQDDYKALSMVTDQRVRYDFADAAYNGGRRGVLDERRACGLKVGCDPQIWFGHVELVCLKSRAALYGRTACVINREHVTMVSRIRSAKYRSLMA